MSGSRWLAALGAALIFIGGAAGIGDVIGTKYALLIAVAGGAINVFTERIQGGASTQ
jgi:hypothetical protein